MRNRPRGGAATDRIEELSDGIRDAVDDCDTITAEVDEALALVDVDDAEEGEELDRKAVVALLKSARDALGKLSHLGMAV